MCTVTIIPIGADAGYRLVTNRDEQRSRPVGLPPSAQVRHGRRWLWPKDGLAGGSWIGASDSGLTLCILNLNPTPRPALPPREALTSRGLLIPGLARCRDAEEAMALLAERRLDAFAPFRLVAIDLSSIAVARWDRTRLVAERSALRPMCLTSSGLGDDLVGERLELFEERLRAEGPTRRMQDAFHAHVWPDRPHLSVWMSRPDARTVSRTEVEVIGPEPARVEMRYAADDLTAVERLPGRDGADVHVRSHSPAALGTA
ncbi:MAG: NRDE family protein [Phycisphaerales bacterium]|nr:NRDE family protein [Phycisphaerales bacterium]